MPSPRINFRLSDNLKQEVLELFPGGNPSQSYVEAFEYAVRQKRSELSDNVQAPPVRQLEEKVSDNSKTVRQPVRQSNKEPVRQDTSVRQEENIDDLREVLSQMMEGGVELPKHIPAPVNDDPHDTSELI